MSANFEKNNSDGIPERISQAEYRALPEADSRMAEAYKAIKRGSKDSI